MMNGFWTTVLSTAGASAIISGVITSVASIWLQHRYNRKIESFKADLSKMLNEDQTRFNWWYLEKAKAIKAIYANLATASYLLQKIHSIETDPRWQINQQTQNQSRQETLFLLIDALEKNTKDWFQLRLFFEEKDDFHIQDNILDEAHFLEFYVLRLANNKIEDLRNIGPVLLNEIEGKMRLLRSTFRDTLGVPDQNAESSSPQAHVDTSSKKDEVK